MDWNAAVEKHRTALRRVLAGLLVMAGFVAGARCGARGARPATLPRHLHRAVLRLLRPAEAAVRRLVIVAARGVVVEVMPKRPPPLTPPHKGEGDSEALATPSPLRGSEGRERRVALPGRVRGGRMPRAPSGHQRNTPEAVGFRLFDPPSRWGRGRPRTAQVCVPRIGFPGLTKLAPVRLPPMPGDLIDTAPLARRFDALGNALDDLPRQALRFARWRARTAHAARHAATQGKAAGRVRFRRVWPLRPGRPPGRRPVRDRGPSHEVHVILEDTHGLAMAALEAPDTS